MAKQKVTKNTNVEEQKIDFSNKTTADVYEGLVCLDLKLSKLVDIMDKVLEYTQRKEKGELG